MTSELRSTLAGALFAAAALLVAGRDAAACDEHVFLNQAGFYTEGPKLAVIATPAEQSITWKLVDVSGAQRAGGRTHPYGDDPLSGEHVHLAEFGEFEKPGGGYRLVAGCAESHPFRISARPFAALKHDALRYFYHSRSGVPIKAEYAGDEAWARPAGHAPDVATCRADKDAQGNRWPGCDYELDATGGWYDAGDQGKYVVNGGIAVWTLLNLYERLRSFGHSKPFADGRMHIPESGNGVNDLLDEARVELEFLLAMQAPRGSTARVPVGVKQSRPHLEFTEIDASGMAHHKLADAEWTPLGTPPHLDRQPRVLYPVSTAATLNLAATAAQCARIWRDVDDAFAARCLDAARRAWAAARRNPEVWFIAEFEGSGMYGDRDLSDEFFWAAAELYVTTGKAKYRRALMASPHLGERVASEPGWSRVAPLGLISLALASGRLEPETLQAVRQRLLSAARRFRDERARAGFHVPYATERYGWGSNSNVLNRAILLALAYDFTGEAEYRNAVVDAMDYLLGRNPLDRSYVSGYGERPFTNPHHRFWAPSVDAGLPPPPPGVLSGGPNVTSPAEEVARALVAKGCAPQTCWADDVRAYSLNEVAINWNAPLVWVAAFLDDAAR
ncbi:MAG TPA: glycoside hydrolase family 9 protein [Woeseiaceae bacterium]|nr:glycoside hydrolase family 9 protein [Woeseiaceae bacterium]